MDYTSPKQAHSSNSKLSSPPPPPIIGENHKPRTTTTNCTTNLIITQALEGPNVPSPEPITAVALPASTHMGPVARYRECKKNHAASTGGHVLDGCGEFMPASSDGDSPEALKCAACECHRSFHRKEVAEENPNHNRNKNNSMARENMPRGSSTASQAVLLPPQHYFNPQIRHQYHHHRQQQPVMVAFGGAESSSEDLNALNRRSGLANTNDDNNSSKKRFRTKFKEGQKERMTEFAEKLGWRIQKHDEDEVQRFCSEVGVKRQVFKVWMHNNKQAMKKKDGNADINGNGDHH